MSGRPFRRTALPCARGRTAHLVLVAALALTTFLLFCAGSPPAEASERRPHSVSLVDRDPCGHSPGEHDCHSSDPAAVLGQMPLPGADHTAAPWQPAPAPAALAPSGAGEPGLARPPDLHELQLLRV
ncbi:hypothetical protein E4N62_24265 [Streptomyces sp. MNU76]|uniref:hypothetical protein n=1 Tax=Streptomyces sp. MNU76 TaxID=2560026 RepID=UPI001E375071|nr:hypothetical protein [Streptomyces sp. MNU76]MCC9708098.1 hypothetical protein [Streptomyces sp. MNU76]